jgi:LuxR family quorum sensing-dependent transcriptional regulator
MASLARATVVSTTNPMAIFDVIAELEQASSIDAIMDLVMSELGRHGFGAVMIGGLPEDHIEDAVLANRWPPEFFQLYMRNNYIRHDPIAKRCRLATEPFDWDGKAHANDPDPLTVELMRHARDYGLARGFVVPIHNPHGFEACVSMAGVDLDLPRETRFALHVLAIYAHAAVRRLAAPEPVKRPALTPREREVLAWAAHGKSAWEIGEILHIAKRTVDEHATTAFHKLGASNRAHAVAIAVRDRIIEL